MIILHCDSYRKDSDGLLMNMVLDIEKLSDISSNIHIFILLSNTFSIENKITSFTAQDFEISLHLSETPLNK